MCNACGNQCCGSDMFGGCGCDGCYCEECWSEEDEGEIEAAEDALQDFLANGGVTLEELQAEIAKLPTR